LVLDVQDYALLLKIAAEIGEPLGGYVLLVSVQLLLVAFFGTEEGGVS
jgi:hypothetical protein